MPSDLARINPIGLISLGLIGAGWAILVTMIGVSAQEKTVLQGSIEENARAQTRLHRFEGMTPQEDNQAPHTRIHRSEVIATESASIDPELFAAKPVGKYDLEAESNSRELTLAWELWHKQLIKAIYERTPVQGIGACAFQVTVTRDHHVTLKVLRSWGDPIVRRNVVGAVMSLDDNLGLSFPAGSKREVAYDSHVLLVGPNIKPGYTWDKSDFEKVRVSW